MALIDNILKEIRNTPEEEIQNEFNAWATRLKKEGISIYSLERLVQFHFSYMNSSRNRSKLRFKKIDIISEFQKTNNDGVKVNIVKKNVKKSILSKIKNFIRL